MLGRDGQWEIGCTLFVLAGHSVGYLPQLTLFPRFSETFEAKLGDIFAFFWEHLLKQRLFYRFQLLVLTLMKGDERVELLEESADAGLLL